MLFLRELIPRYDGIAETSNLKGAGTEHFIGSSAAPLSICS
jgi:hypothetical protein